MDERQRITVSRRSPTDGSVQNEVRQNKPPQRAQQGQTRPGNRSKGNYGYDPTTYHEKYIQIQ